MSKNSYQENVVNLGFWSDAWRRLWKNKLSLVSGIYLLIIAIICFSSPFLPLKPWDIVDFANMAQPPTLWEYPFGTDKLGRDMLARLIVGGRVTLTVAIMSALTSVILGVIIGAIAGYIGGIIDRIVMFIIQVLYSIPTYFIMLCIMSFWNVQNIYTMFMIVALLGWLSMARVVRSQVLSLKEREFVLALRAAGVPGWRILFLHLVPNSLGIVVTYATIMIPGVVLTESFLSFIGIPFTAMGTDGIPKEVASWGTLISEGVREFESYWWMLFFPSLFLTLTLLAMNFLGDGIRDALDPNLRK